jgi:hypothetical protein
MATGASKAKRDAKKQAQAAYFKAISGAKRITPLRHIDTDSARRLDDDLGEDLSYGSKRLAMQADKLGKKINADKSFKGDVDKFNKRYDEIKLQMSGKTIKKFEVVENDTGPRGMADIGINGISLASTQSANDKYDTAEEAKKEASTRVETKKTGPLGMSGERLSPGLIEYSIGDVAKNSARINPYNANLLGAQPTEPNYKVQAVDLQPITTSYRSLPQTKGAYEDLDKLTNNLAANPVNKFAESYETIAAKLKNRLKRDVDTIPKQNLNSPDILTGGVAQEVIK